MGGVGSVRSVRVAGRVRGRSGAGSLWLGPGPGRGPGRVRCGRVVGRVVGPLRSGEGGVRDGACPRMNE